jgi:hypothetical protein
LMTLSWDTRYSSFAKEVGARPDRTTQPILLAFTKFGAALLH